MLEHATAPKAVDAHDKHEQPNRAFLLGCKLDSFHAHTMPQKRELVNGPNC
jgi:hypothetical protein